jgi:hypothetical protein
MDRKLFSAQEIAASLASDLGKGISSEYVYANAKSLWGEHISFTPSEKFTVEFKIQFTLYANTWYRHRNRKTFKAHLDSLGQQIPERYTPVALVAAPKGKEKMDTSGKLTASQMAEMFDRRDREIKKSIMAEIEEKIKITSRVSIASSQEAITRASDPAMVELEKRINKFVFDEPWAVRDVWKRLRSDFETRNGIKVTTFGVQTFPQWLRSENMMEMFMGELQGFLDAMHDERTPAPSKQLSFESKF